MVRVRGHTGATSAAREGAMAGRAWRRLNNNVEATFQGFAGADYDLQARCSGGVCRLDACHRHCQAQAATH